MTVRVIPFKKRLTIMPESIFFRFLAISLILHGLFICVVSYNNENFRKKLMAQIRNAVPVKVLIYQQNIPKVTPIKTEIPPAKKETPPKNESIALKSPEISPTNKSIIPGSRVALAPGGKAGSPGIRYSPQSCGQLAVPPLKVTDSRPAHSGKQKHLEKPLKKDANYIPLPGNISRYNRMETPTPEIKKTEKDKKVHQQIPPVIRKRKKIEAASLNKDSQISHQKREKLSPVITVPMKQAVTVSSVEPMKAEPENREEIPMPSSDSGGSDTSSSSSSFEAKDNVIPGNDGSPVSDGIPKPSKRTEETASSNRGNGAENPAASAANPKPAENTNSGKKGREKKRVDGEEMKRRLAEFRGIVAGRIESVKVYPHEARQERQEGKVVISFIIDPGGNIGKVSIVSSSGFHLLDRAASEAAEAGAPYQPFPVGLNKPVRIKMTVNFKIS